MKDSLKEFYEDYWQYREDIGKIHTKEGAHIPKRLTTALSMIPDEPKLKILDIGCGDGTFGMLVKQKLKDVYVAGCDISSRSLELAKPHYDKVSQFNIDQDRPSKLGRAKYDYIVVTEVIEHLLDPKTALEKCKELLAPSGYIITSFPNIAWWKYRMKLLRGHFPEESRLYHHAEHLHDFTTHSFNKLMEGVGLEVVDIGGEFIPPDWMKRYISEKNLDKLYRKYPNLFGYQIVYKTKAVK